MKVMSLSEDYHRLFWFICSLAAASDEKLSACEWFCVQSSCLVTRGLGYTAISLHGMCQH